MLPHERSLVERLEGRPFALIGINSDDDKESFHALAKENGVTWRNSWQGSTSGPLPSLWGVQAWPAVYLLDGDGVIREVYEGAPRGEQLDERIDALVEDLEDRRKKKD